MDENIPPWDTNYISSNVIDIQMPFVPVLGIFDEAPVKKPQDSSPISSEPSIPLAIKYRPKTFKELIGQDSISKTLSLALGSGKIANGYLFSGLRGSGKTSSARIFAKCLQCDNGITPNPCGKCPNCIAALDGSHIDIVELDGASNRRIDDIREIIELTKYKPTLGRFKIFIIDEVHMLTKEAFNSLLKTLEEPPPYVKFILATTDPLKIPSTILSRTQHFRFKKIPTSAIKLHLQDILKKEKIASDSESLDMIIRGGGGSLRDTLTLLDQAIVFCQSDIRSYKLASMLGFVEQSIFDNLFESLLRNDTKACIAFINQVSGYDTEMILDELSISIKNKLLEESPYISPVLGMRYANIISDSKNMLKLDCDEEFCLLLTILKMLEAQKVREIKEVIKESEHITKDKPQITTAPKLPTQMPQSAPDNAIPNTNKHNNDNNSTAPAPIAQENMHEKLFNDFINEAYIRDYEMGDILKHKVRFSALTDNALHLLFYTSEDETSKLRKGYKGMMSIIAKIFGNHISLKVEKRNPRELNTSNITRESTTTTQPKPPIPQAPIPQAPQPNINSEIPADNAEDVKAKIDKITQNILMNNQMPHLDSTQDSMHDYAAPQMPMPSQLDNTQSHNSAEYSNQSSMHTQIQMSHHDVSNDDSINTDSANITSQPSKIAPNMNNSQDNDVGFLQELSQNKEIIGDMKNKLGITAIQVVPLDELNKIWPQPEE